MTTTTTDDEDSNPILIDVQNDREAQFLASQQARLEKIRINAEQNSALLDNDNAQQKRKDFWIMMKNICSSFDSQLSVLIGENEEEEGEISAKRQSKSDVENSCRKNKDSRKMYVTAQQRNEALAKLQAIQLTIRCLGHYTLHPSKFTTDEEKYLPTELIKFTMPELPTADLRLLNTEIQVRDQ